MFTNKTHEEATNKLKDGDIDAAIELYTKALSEAPDDYNIISDSNSSTLTFFVPALTEEIEIIGTHVIPEFPFGVIMGLVILFSTIILMSRTKTTVFRL